MLSPIGAAIVVSVMPLAALVGSRIGGWVADARARAAAGALLAVGWPRRPGAAAEGDVG